MVEVATVGVLGALPLSYTGFFGTTLPGNRTRHLIPKSHFTDQALNHCTIASIQRISLKCMLRYAYINRSGRRAPGDQGFPAPLIYEVSWHKKIEMLFRTSIQMVVPLPTTIQTTK